MSRADIYTIAATVLLTLVCLTMQAMTPTLIGGFIAMLFARYSEWREQQ